jgi:hypothetical protein
VVSGSPIVTVEAVVAPASFGWVVLQLRYDGRKPPAALLDDIARLGWSVPPPPSRPASAIDWYTPDPLTGERFTVKPWRAVHDIDPPGRGTTRAAWTSEQRAQALGALGPVLLGHQVDVSSPVPELVTATGPPPPAAPEPDEGGQPAIVTFTAPAERQEPIDGFLRSTGLAYWMANEVRTRQQLFRGSRLDVDVKVVVGEVLVRTSQAEALATHLRGEHAVIHQRDITPEDLERIDVCGSAVAVRLDPPAAPPRGTGLVLLRVVLPATAGPAIERLAGDPALAGALVTAAPGTRSEQVTYRGSVTEVARPCLHLEVDCPADRVAVVRAAMARRTRVPEGQIEVIATRP